MCRLSRESPYHGPGQRPLGRTASTAEICSSGRRVPLPCQGLVHIRRVFAVGVEARKTLVEVRRFFFGEDTISVCVLALEPLRHSLSDASPKCSAFFSRPFLKGEASFPSTGEGGGSVVTFSPTRSAFLGGGRAQQQEVT